MSNYLDGYGKPRCDFCGLKRTKEGHDGCIGELENVMNACCGHGEVGMAYVQFSDKKRIKGNEAIMYIKENSPNPDKQVPLERMKGEGLSNLNNEQEASPLETIVSVPKELLVDLADHAFKLSRMIEKHEGDLPSCEEAVRYIDTNAAKAKKIIQEAH